MDPLSEVVLLLQPGAAFSKIVTGAGSWSVTRPDVGHAFFTTVLEGSCHLEFDGHPPMTLQAGDFVLIPANPGFTMSSLEPATPSSLNATATLSPTGELRLGVQSGPPDVRLMGGYFVFGSPDAALLVSLLPKLIHVHGEDRLQTIVKLVRDESREQRPARDVVIARLLEVLLIEALRSSKGTAASPGLVRGLADARLASTIRQMHEHPTRQWTVAELANSAALSRSAFFDRFNRVMGIAPMEYLLAWRMTLAKDLLRRKQGAVAEVAARVGYGSASTFSTAFTRYVGQPPTHYALAMKQSV